MSRINTHTPQTRQVFFKAKVEVYLKIFKKMACKKANQVKVLATKSDDPGITWKDQTNSLKL